MLDIERKEGRKGDEDRLIEGGRERGLTEGGKKGRKKRKKGSALKTSWWRTVSRKKGKVCLNEGIEGREGRSLWR